jgi:hypothetical protein
MILCQSSRVPAHVRVGDDVDQVLADQYGVEDCVDVCAARLAEMGASLSLQHINFLLEGIHDRSA